MIYPFVCHGCGHKWERGCRPSQLPAVIHCPKCDARAQHDYSAKFSTPQVGDIYRHHESLSMAVHPDTIPQYRKFDRTHGLDVEYTKKGRPVFTSRSERIRYVKAHGFVDRDRYA